MTLNLDQVLDKGFLLFFGVAVIWSSVWLGKRLLNKDDGLLSILVGKHIEFLGQIEQTTSRMADSHKRLSLANDTLCEISEKHAQEHAEDMDKLQKAAHNAVIVLKRIAIKLEIYDDVKSHLDEIDGAVTRKDSWVKPSKPKEHELKASDIGSPSNLK